jgi:hypothetical protein
VLVPLTQIFHRVLERATEPQVLVTLVGVFLLTVIWATTLGVIRVKHSDAQHAAAISTREILGTYEAQIVRSLREIDQTLNLVKYWHERDGAWDCARCADTSGGRHLRAFWQSSSRPFSVALTGSWRKAAYGKAKPNWRNPCLR